MQMKALTLTLAAGAALAGATVALVHACYRRSFFSDRSKRRDPYKNLEREELAPYRETAREKLESLAARPAESVTVFAHDGLRLAAKLYHGAPDAPFHVMLHGYKSSPLCDLAGVAADLAAAGESVLLVDQRAHGESAGHVIAFGAMERRDLVRWCEYAERELAAKRIFLWGISMGAATVVSALELPLPASVCGAIADCPYSSASAIIARVAERRGMKPALVLPLTRLGALLFGGFRLAAANPEEAVKKAGIPLLVLHGERDDFVPPSMSLRIAEAALDAGRSVERHTFPEAGHGMSYIVDPVRYMETARAFIEKALKARESETCAERPKSAGDGAH